MPDRRNKSFMRSLGEFVGHIVRGVKSDVKTRDEPRRREVRRTVEEDDRGDMVLRRTIIEEVEIRQAPPQASTREEAADEAHDEDSGQER